LGNFLEYKAEVVTIHSISILAVLADHVVPLCHQIASDVQWKWWLTSLAPWVGPLLSCVVSIYVAWKVFRWQAEKDRKQWIRDQSKAEWKELLVKIAEIEHHIPILIRGIPDHEGLDLKVMGLLPALRGTVFVYSSLESSGFIGRWEDFVGYISGKFSRVTGT
jgi:hypothetical protein